MGCTTSPGLFDVTSQSASGLVELGLHAVTVHRRWALLAAAAKGVPATTEAAQAAAAAAALPAVRLAADAAFLSRALTTQSRLVIAAASLSPHPQRPASAAALLDNPLVRIPLRLWRTGLKHYQLSLPAVSLSDDGMIFEWTRCFLGSATWFLESRFCQFCRNKFGCC